MVSASNFLTTPNIDQNFRVSGLGIWSTTAIQPDSLGGINLSVIIVRFYHKLSYAAMDCLAERDRAMSSPLVLSEIKCFVS